MALQREIDALIIQVEQGDYEMLDLYEQKRAEKESLHMVLIDLPPIDSSSNGRSPFRVTIFSFFEFLFSSSTDSSPSIFGS